MWGPHVLGGEVARLFAFGVTRWEGCMAHGVPKIKKKADGFKGLLIPNKESRCGAIEKRKTNWRHKDDKGNLTYSCGLHGSC